MLEDMALVFLPGTVNSGLCWEATIQFWNDIKRKQILLFIQSLGSLLSST